MTVNQLLMKNSLGKLWFQLCSVYLNSTSTSGFVNTKTASFEVA